MSASFEDLIRNSLPPEITLISPLGAGGQGTVFRGQLGDVPVAIKVFSTETDKRRVDRECDLLSRLNCPHVVHVLRHFDAEVNSETLRFVVYEFHAGGDLVSLLDPRKDPIPESQLVRIGHDVGVGISTLWKHRIVHRDIKPANIVQADDERYLLVDMGLARHLDRSALTAAGIPGTRGFRSPEQSLGRRALTINSDVYSLGLTLFVLASRRHPFNGNDILSPTNIDFSLMSAGRPLSQGFVNLVKQMLDFTPSRRPSNIVDSFSALGGI